MKIIVTNQLPPIGTTSFDWCAYIEDDLERTGFGATRSEALRNLADIIEELEDKEEEL